MDDDNKTPTPLLSSRHSTSPAPSRPPGCVSGSGPGSGVPQLSPLETARLKMTHSVGAAAAVGLASATPDVFEFADDRSVGSGSAYPSPSPQYTPFAYGTVGSPISGQSMRGTVTKRRPRARKTANMGDRMGELQQTAGKDPAMAGIPTRKPRGKTGVRRPRGSRKAALAMSHAELEMQQRIPKVPSRASPSVDAQKTKSIPMQSMPKLEKQEKKRDKEKKEGHKERSKDKSDESRRAKRKAEGKEKDREHKRHKREEVKETTKEREAPPPNPVQQVAPTPPPLPTPAPNPPPLPAKASMPRKNSAPVPPPPIPVPRQPLLSTPPAGPAGLPMPGPLRKPPTLPDPRDRRPSMIGAPPFRGSMSSIPLPKGPPPPQATPTGGGTWIRPPSHIPTQSIRSPSPDPNAMQIDDDLNSPEDSLRIADD
ncbi:hypothetical protein TELCIR_01298 [Teladorsagia circumcincta]|uniref:Uncharacterized protein n=1 Tax=Teladorsagia circumcincta TaxID=45464 RepID=A0A2G9V3R9_TELCI|nr:hypothetical protein TELCIR_01298 [Teladorsagia circumcincta]